MWELSVYCFTYVGNVLNLYSGSPWYNHRLEYNLLTEFVFSQSYQTNDRRVQTNKQTMIPPPKYQLLTIHEDIPI